MAKQRDDGAAGDDLVVQHDDVLAAHLADHRADLNHVVLEPLLGAHGHGGAQPPGEGGGLLGVAEVGRHHDGVGKIVLAEVRRKLLQGMQVVDRHAEEAVHLGRVQRGGQHPVRPGGGQEVGYQPPAQRDARRVLLVGTGIGVVGHHHRDPRSGGPPGGVDHQEQFDQMLLHRRR